MSQAVQPQVNGLAVSNSNPMPVTVLEGGGSASITVAAGKHTVTTTAANVLTSNAARKSVTIDNPSGVMVWFSFTSTAAATIGDSMPLYPQTRVTFDVSEVGTGALSMVAASSTTVRVMQSTQ
jgi:hypothetical protein